VQISLLVDLILREKDAVIIGRGYEVEKRARQLWAERANIVVLTDSSTAEALDSTILARPVEIRSNGLDKWKETLLSKRPFLTVITTENEDLDEEIARFASTVSKLVYVVDRPHLNDLNMTGVAKLGDIRVAVSTGGVSPAMAGVLRRKIESVIAPEDILQVKLQAQMRKKIRKSFSDPSARKKVVYKLIRDRKISAMLQSGEFDNAKGRALNIIAKSNQ
jgi:precorrin-2 dehydrogenase / sirohydrochlorin ferrochelatase